MPELKSYPVWDVPTRWFHWINALCVIGLAAVGLVVLNAGALGASSAGKIALKTIHTWIGYVFVLNFASRIVWGFVGNRYARWRAVLPGGRGYWRAVRIHAAALLSGRLQPHLGHNPLGRLAVSVLLLLLAVQAVTGIVLAGTDLFYPPIGAWIAQWVAAQGVDPATLVPYAPEIYDKAAWEEMRAFRKPFVTLHLYSFYLLAGLVVLHVAVVVVTEVRQGGGIVSAMFTGRKVLAAAPADAGERT